MPISLGDLDSPEILLVFMMPLIFIYYSITNDMNSKLVLEYAILIGMLIYLSAIALKNVAIKYLNFRDNDQMKDVNNVKTTESVENSIAK